MSLDYESLSSYSLRPLTDRITDQIGAEAMLKGILKGEIFLIGPTPECLSVGTAGDYVFGRLARREIRRAEAHLVQCEYCPEAVRQALEYEVQRERQLLPQYARVEGPWRIIEDMAEGWPELISRFPLFVADPDMILTGSQKD